MMVVSLVVVVVVVMVGLDMPCALDGLFLLGVPLGGTGIGAKWSMSGSGSRSEDNLDE